MKEFCKKLWKQNNTWNIRRSVDESFVPATQQPSDPATQRPSDPAYYIEDFRILGAVEYLSH